MRVIVAGATVWTDEAPIRRELAKLPSSCVIIHGDCAGVDAIAGRLAALEFGFTVEAHRKEPVDQRTHPRAPWMGLNERMIRLGCDLVLGFHALIEQPGQARGTRHLIDLAREQGIEVRTFSG